MNRKTIQFVFTAHGTISRIKAIFGDASGDDDDDDDTHSIDFYFNAYDRLLNGLPVASAWWMRLWIGTRLSWRTDSRNKWEKPIRILCAFQSKQNGSSKHDNCLQNNRISLVISVVRNDSVRFDKVQMCQTHFTRCGNEQRHSCTHILWWTVCICGRTGCVCGEWSLSNKSVIILINFVWCGIQK